MGLSGKFHLVGVSLGGDETVLLVNIPSQEEARALANAIAPLGDYHHIKVVATGVFLPRDRVAPRDGLPPDPRPADPSMAIGPTEPPRSDGPATNPLPEAMRGLDEPAGPHFRIVAVRRKDGQRILVAEGLGKKTAEETLIILPSGEWEKVIERSDGAR